jgi:hypothetical protein
MTRTIKAKGNQNFKINLEIVDNGQEVVDLSRSRPITDDRFLNEEDFTQPLRQDFHGVRTFDEALALMGSGCPEITKELKEYENKIDLHGEGKHIQFHNDVAGFAPIVPLAMQGIPTCMINSHVKKMQNKVLNIYYEIGASARFTPGQFREAGCKLLAALMKLEMQGYRFNLFGIASFTGHSSQSNNDADMLIVKLKDARQPFDLKRLSFPLAHPGFFRAITFEWYEKVPGGKYRNCFGYPLCSQYTREELTPMFEDLFHQKCVVFGLQYLLDVGDNTLKEVLIGGK